MSRHGPVNLADIAFQRLWPLGNTVGPVVQSVVS